MFTNYTLRRLAVPSIVAAAALLAGGCGHSGVPKGDPAFAPARPAEQPVAVVNPGAIFQPGHAVALFEDSRARRVGDLLTIVLTESTNATKSANTSTSKDNDVQITSPTLFGQTLPTEHVDVSLEQNLQSSQAFDGEGASAQSNVLTGTITVTVAEVYANGNMLVRGEKLLTLNQGDEYIRLSGLVRPQDIQPDNSVLSTQVADARIIYSGKGAIADANANGWLGRFFQSRFWPF